ncbi:hypothetical protein RRG08_005005 [Elysia crispata]|uniref:Fibrinogen C-terminal domain-containing protein n=1 Tax=Elysia crispata TaxID=231223 RepID=A0AAE1A952_9GAST|nr:hypothetical protein RRG08_005005 [Elysia crispata]
MSDEENGFRRNVGGYSGTAGDDLAYSSGRKFTTLDRDNDSCHLYYAAHYYGAWWCGGCAEFNLNGDDYMIRASGRNNQVDISAEMVISQERVHNHKNKQIIVCRKSLDDGYREY